MFTICKTWVDSYQIKIKIPAKKRNEEIFQLRDELLTGEFP